MKKSIYKSLLLSKLALRNIKSSLFRFSLFLLSLSFLVLTLYLSFTTKDFLSLYYNNEYKEIYHDIDLKMNPTLESNARFFSITPLLNSNLYQNVSNYFQVFELETTIVHDENTINANLFSSTIEQFESYLKTNQSFILLEHDVIITKSFAYKENIHLLDTISITINNETNDYQVAYIVEDFGLFSNEKIFINQVYIIKTIIKTLAPNLGDLQDAIYERFTNQLYLYLKDDVDIDLFSSQLKLLNEYQSLSITPPYSQEKINQNIHITTTFFTIILFTISLSLIIFFYSNLKVMLLNRKKQYLNLETIGFNHRYIRVLILIELSYALIPSFIIGIFLSLFVIKYGLFFLGSNATYILNIPKMILILIFLLILIYCSSLFSHSSKTKPIYTSIKSSVKWLSLIVLTLILIIFLYSQYRIIFILIYIAIILISLTFKLPFLLATRYKQNTRNVLLLKMTINKPVYKSYMVSLFVCFTSIFLLFYANSHINHRISSYQSFYEFDFYLTNITRNINVIDQDLSERTDLKHEMIYLDTNVTLNESLIMEFIAISPSAISEFYDLSLDKDTLDLFMNETDPSILLPKNYQAVYQLTAGDIIEISSSLGNISSYKIIGFYEKELGNLIFSNFHTDAHQENTFIIKSLIEKDKIKTDLITEYQSEFIVVFDYDSILKEQTTLMANIRTYINIIILFIMLALIFSLLNQQTLLYASLKENYIKLQVLGFNQTKTNMYLRFETVLMYLVLIIVSFLYFLILLSLIQSLYLSFGLYEKYYDYRLSTLYAFLLITLIYVVVRYFYHKKTYNEAFSSVFNNFD